MLVALRFKTVRKWLDDFMLWRTPHGALHVQACTARLRCSVPVGVVDGFEVSQIDQPDGEPHAFANRAKLFPLQQFANLTSVDEAHNSQARHATGRDADAN
jgi:hypothetical protein